MNFQAMRPLLALPGDIAFYVEDFASGECLSWNAEQPIQAASVIKLLVMAEAFRQRAQGLLDFDGELRICREDKLPSCGALSYMRDGQCVCWGDLVTLMIILSDNTATNLLIDRLGMERINALIDGLGLTATRLRRKLFQQQLSAQGIQNVVSAADMAKLLRLLLQGRLVSPEASEEMLGLLGNQRLNGKLPFYLHSRGIRCAHKTGEDDGITHDVGIVYAATPRIFCFLSEHTDVPAAERALQALGALTAEVAL